METRESRASEESGQLRGIVVPGRGLGRHFASLSWARSQFIEKLGIAPYAGTLNLRLTERAMCQRWVELRQRSAELIRAGAPGACEARCFHVDINGQQTGAIVWPQIEAYPDDLIELIAGCNLRQALGIADGSPVTIQLVPPAEALRRTVQAYLAAHNVLSLATYGPGGPWAASVFYVHLDWMFYFLSNSSSRHSCNIALDSCVAATINPDYTDWQEIRGVQLQGTASLVTNPSELVRAMAAYQRKYPFVTQQRLSAAELTRALGHGKLYRLVPRQVLFVDNSRGLGYREAVDITAV